MLKISYNGERMVVLNKEEINESNFEDFCVDFFTLIFQNVMPIDERRHHGKYRIRTCTVKLYEYDIEWEEDREIASYSYFEDVAHDGAIMYHKEIKDILQYEQIIEDDIFDWAW